MTYYQYRSSQIMADNGWKIMLLLGINQKDFKFENINQEEKKQIEEYYSHWTIKYSHTLGNKRFIRNMISLIVFILDFITFVVLCVIHYKFNDENKFDECYVVLLFCQMLLLFILGVFVSLFCFYNVSKFSDFIFIKHEIIGMCIIGCIISILIAIWTKFDYHNILVLETKDVNALSTLFWFFIISLMSFMLSTLTLSWVIYKYNPDLITFSIDWYYYFQHCIYLIRMYARRSVDCDRQDKSDIDIDPTNSITVTNNTTTPGITRATSFDLSLVPVDKLQFKGTHHRDRDDLHDHDKVHPDHGEFKNADSSGSGQLSTTTPTDVYLNFNLTSSKSSSKDKFTSPPDGSALMQLK